MVFYGRKLKRPGLINFTYTIIGTVHILRTVGERPIKVFHMSRLLELYPNFGFSKNDDDVSVDASGGASVQSSY